MFSRELWLVISVLWCFFVYFENVFLRKIFLFSVENIFQRLARTENHKCFLYFYSIILTYKN
jgi:hypothetical protein